MPSGAPTEAQTRQGSATGNPTPDLLQSYDPDSPARYVREMLAGLWTDEERGQLNILGQVNKWENEILKRSLRKINNPGLFPVDTLRYQPKALRRNLRRQRKATFPRLKFVTRELLDKVVTLSRIQQIPCADFWYKEQETRILYNLTKQEHDLLLQEFDERTRTLWSMVLHKHLVHVFRELNSFKTEQNTRGLPGLTKYLEAYRVWSGRYINRLSTTRWNPKGIAPVAETFPLPCGPARQPGPIGTTQTPDMQQANKDPTVNTIPVKTTSAAPVVSVPRKVTPAQQRLLEQLGLTTPVTVPTPTPDPLQYQIRPVPTQKLVEDHRPSNATLPHSRPKRQIGLLATGILGGYVYYRAALEDTRYHQMEEAIEILQDENKRTMEEMVSIRGEMLSVVKKVMEDYEDIKHAIRDVQGNIDAMASEIIRLQINQNELMQEMEEVHVAMYYLSYVIGNMFPATERVLSMYEFLVTELDFLMDSLDSLSNGLLSHKLIAPNDLHNLIEKVKGEITASYPEYTLVMDEVQEYYDFPLTRFRYAEGNLLVVQLPMFVRHYAQVPMQVFGLQTVKVPLNVNQPLNKSDQAAFTQLQPKHQVLAMSATIYVAMEKVQLEGCYKYGTWYLCPQAFLTQHNAHHTCESAIYFRQDVKLIKSLCEFKYYQDITPEPTILDSGKDLLLANVPQPWTVICTHERHVPRISKTDTYLLIQKSSLCQCSIHASTYFIHENIGSCDKNHTNRPLQLTYTVNQAALIYYPEMSTNLELTRDIELQNPSRIQFATPKLNKIFNKDVLHRTQLGPSHLKDIVPLIEKNNALWKSQADKALSGKQLLALTNKHSWKFVAMIVVVVLIICLVLGIVAYCYCRRWGVMRQLFHHQSHTPRQLEKVILPDSFTKYFRKHRPQPARPPADSQGEEFVGSDIEMSELNPKITERMTLATPLPRVKRRVPRGPRQKSAPAQPI